MTTIVAQSASLKGALALADRFAPTPLPILLLGPTGTGKELFARRIHALSGRPGPLVPVNCAALPREMVESLMFGHRRGAFTGALHDSPGFIEAAAGGTLYLDELSSLPAEAQGKLLRILEDRDVFRLGDTSPRRSDFRLVASTQQDLVGRVMTGAFRLDLYERIAGAVVELAPLCERTEDVVPLAEHFAGLGGRGLGRGTAEVLLKHTWPGNVRELRLAIERAGYLADDGTLEPSAMTEAIALGLPASVDALPSGSGPATEEQRLVILCASQGWNARRTAAALEMPLSSLYAYLRRMGISLRERRTSTRLEHLGRSSRISRNSGHPATDASATNP